MGEPDFQIVELTRSRRDVMRFLKVAYGVYRDDPRWVAPLLVDQRKVFEDGNPLFEHAEMTLWVAVRNGRDVGRIAGTVERLHNEFHKETTAYFGFFEGPDDPAVSGALFDAVSVWARARGMTRLLGPMNPTTNDECGLLISGFDASPVVMMTYNPRYYPDLFAAAGLTKAKDLLAYYFDVKPKPLERFNRIAAGVRRREPNIVIRQIRKKTLAADLAKVREVYNAAWEANWGFVPMTEGDMAFMAERLKPLLVEELALLAERDGEPIAFMMSLPDYNEALRPMRGRLLTPRIFGLLSTLWGRRTPKIVRVVTTGVKRAYRQRGMDALLFGHGLTYGLKAGYQGCEVSWVLEDNVQVLRPLEIFDAYEYKRYRIYERAV